MDKEVEEAMMGSSDTSSVEENEKNADDDDPWGDIDEEIDQLVSPISEASSTHVSKKPRI